MNATPPLPILIGTELLDDAAAERLLQPLVALDRPVPVAMLIGHIVDRLPEHLVAQSPVVFTGDLFTSLENLGLVLDDLQGLAFGVELPHLAVIRVPSTGMPTVFVEERWIASSGNIGEDLARSPEMTWSAAYAACQLQLEHKWPGTLRRAGAIGSASQRHFFALAEAVVRTHAAALAANAMAMTPTPLTQESLSHVREMLALALTAAITAKRDSSEDERDGVAYRVLYSLAHTTTTLSHYAADLRQHGDDLAVPHYVSGNDFWRQVVAAVWPEFVAALRPIPSSGVMDPWIADTAVRNLAPLLIRWASGLGLEFYDRPGRDVAGVVAT